MLSPLLDPTGQQSELANASTLCGACFEACPVKIPLHDHLVQLRRRNVEAGLPGTGEALAFKAYGRLFSSARWFGVLGRMLRALRRRLGRNRSDYWARLLPTFSAWSNYRALPAPPERAFRDGFEERSR